MKGIGRVPECAGMSLDEALRRSEPGGDLDRSEEWIILIGARRLTFSKKPVDDDAHDQRANEKLRELRDVGYRLEERLICPSQTSASATTIADA